MKIISPSELTPEQLQHIIAVFTGEQEDAVITNLNGKKETHIGVALDSSGSMNFIKSDIMGVYNATLEQLQKGQEDLGLVTVTLVTFGEGLGEVAEKYRFKPLATLAPLTDETYHPSGYTPFYDGLGRLLTILETRDKQDGIDRAFLVNVFTDGLENHSREWVNGRIKTKVEELQARGNWTLTYAGANVNLNLVSQDTGLLRQNMIGYQPSHEGVVHLNSVQVNSTAGYTARRGAGYTSSPGFYEAQKDTSNTPT